MTARLGRMTVLTVWLMGACAWPAVAQVVDWPSAKPPAAEPARPAAPAVYRQETLKNGLRVVVVPQHEQPVVSVQMLMPAGSAFDPVGKEGLASLVGSLLTAGSTSRSGRELDDTLESLGGEWSSLTGKDAAFLELTVLRDGAIKGLELLADLVKRPAFPAEDLARNKQQLRAAFQVGYVNPDYLAAIVCDRVLFGSHPYGMPTDGTPRSVARITRDDLMTFHRRFVRPDGSILAVVGDIDADAALAAVHEAFDGWPSALTPLPPIPAPAPPSGGAVYISVPGAQATTIRVGRLAVPRHDPRYLAADIGTRILGGEGGNRLMRELRGNRGLAYDVSARLESLGAAGALTVAATVVPQAATLATSLIQTALRTIGRTPADPAEVEAAVAFVRGHDAIALETPGAVSTRVLTTWFNGLPVETFGAFGALVAAVTPAHVLAAMQEPAGADQLVTVMVGPPLDARTGSGIHPPNGATVIDASQLDLESGTLRATTVIGVADTAPSELSSRLAWDAVKRVFETVATAAGGTEALRRIQAISYRAETLAFTPGGIVPAAIAATIVYPNRTRVEVTTKKATTIQGYDGERAWIADAEHGARDASLGIERDTAASLRRDWLRMVADVANNQLTGMVLPTETDESGRPLTVMRIWADGLPPFTVAVDVETRRIVRLAYDVPGPVGPARMVESYFDFREVSGVWFPFRMVLRRDGTPVFERRIQELVVNPPVDPGAFRKPN